MCAVCANGFGMMCIRAKKRETRTEGEERRECVVVSAKQPSKNHRISSSIDSKDAIRMLVEKLSLFVVRARSCYVHSDWSRTPPSPPFVSCPLRQSDSHPLDQRSCATPEHRLLDFLLVSLGTTTTNRATFFYQLFCLMLLLLW